jgi:hypothetical protein
MYLVNGLLMLLKLIKAIFLGLANALGITVANAEAIAFPFLRTLLFKITTNFFRLILFTFSILTIINLYCFHRISGHIMISMDILALLTMLKLIYLHMYSDSGNLPANI